MLLGGELACWEHPVGLGRPCWHGSEQAPEPLLSLGRLGEASGIHGNTAPISGVWSSGRLRVGQGGPGRATLASARTFFASARVSAQAFERSVF